MTLRIFESVFYKSLIRACSFGNSLVASQNARNCGQTSNHRALRICKKRIQKLLMLSTLIIINIAFHVLSDSYNGTLFKPLQNVYIKLYWISTLDDCYRNFLFNITDIKSPTYPLHHHIDQFLFLIVLLSSFRL